MYVCLLIFFPTLTLIHSAFVLWVAQNIEDEYTYNLAL